MRRVYRNALIILGALTLAALVFFGWGAAASVLIGGALAALNFKWMAAGVDRALGAAAAGSAVTTVLKYVLRLLLIMLGLFAMIHVPFLSLLGGVAGLSIFVLSGMLEAILLTMEEFRPDR